MQLTKGAIGNLINRYKAVLKKCHLLNVFGSLAVAGMLVMGGAGVAGAAETTDKVLSEDISTSVVVSAGNSVNLDLNGYNIATSNTYALLVDGDVTISDSVGTGKIEGGSYSTVVNGSGVLRFESGLINLTNSGNPIQVQQGGQAFISGGTVSGFDTGICLYANGEGMQATVTIEGDSVIKTTAPEWQQDGDPVAAAVFLSPDNGGSVTLNVHGGTISSSTYAIAGNGLRHGTIINITGGDIRSDATAIYHPQDGVMTISGGTINGGDTGIELRSGKLTVSGGEIIGQGNPLDYDANGNGTTTVGAALAVSQHTTNKDIDVNISGGTFTGYYALFEKDMQDDDSDNIKMSVTGGEFNGKIYSENCKDFITGGTFSDPTALHYLGEGANVSIKLQQDYSGERGNLNKKAFKIGSNRTVDMNLGGYTFEMTEEGNTSAGNISIANGTLKLKKDLTVTGGSMTIADEGRMIIADGGLAKFDNDSLLAVNGNALTGNNAAITVDDGGILTVEDKARLRIDNAKSGQTYTIVNKQAGTEQGKWSDGNIEASTDLLTPTTDENGNVTFKRDKDASDVFTGMDSNTAAMLNTLIDKGLNNVDSDQMGVRFLSRATDNHFLGADKDAAAATIESAARIAFAGAVPQMTKMASDAGTNAVVNRLGFANPADGAQAMDAEGKIVDRNTTGFALWIAPLWQSQHGWGMEADNLDYGFNGNLGGVSLGADYTFENAIRAGITFNIGGGYAESSGGDLNSTENRMSFWGLGAYAGWNYENFGLMADVSYTSTWNDLQQDMDSRMGMGDLEADVQASAISAGLRAEYKLETSVLDVIPHIGVRYMSLNTWGFDAESNGGTVLEGDGFHQDIWTFPVGVTFTKDFTLDSGWSFKPSIDFSVIPAAGDIKAKQDVAFTGLPGTYEVETQMMDYLTWQGGVGLELGNDTMSFGVNYTLQAGQHTTGHGVFGSFRYEF